MAVASPEPESKLQDPNATAFCNISSFGAFIEIKIQPETVAAADEQQIQATAPTISIRTQMHEDPESSLGKGRRV